MIVFPYRIKYKYGETIKIRPIFDVHWGNKNCDKKAFKDYLAEDKHCYFIGGGDLYDAIITRDKRYRKSSDDTQRDAIIDEQIDTMEEILKPYRKRIIGLGIGNHEDKLITEDGTNPVNRLCSRLNVQYIGYSWLVKLILEQDIGGRIRTIIIYGHHGWGGGSRTQGADLTKFSKNLNYWDADIFLFGHVHRKQSDRVPRMAIIGNKWVSKPKLLGICGTFLKTYSKTTDPTYSEIKGYPPTEIGGIVVNIKPRGRWVKMWIDV